MSAVYRIVSAILFTMPSLAFAGSQQSAIVGREHAVPQGLAVRCQLAVLPKNERTATFSDGWCTATRGALTFDAIDKVSQAGVERRQAVPLTQLLSSSIRLTNLKTQLLIGRAQDNVAINVLTDDGVRKSRENGLSFLNALATAGVRLGNSDFEVLPYPRGAYGRMPRPPAGTL
jgi:hypothetical protein